VLTATLPFEVQFVLTVTLHKWHASSVNTPTAAGRSIWRHRVTLVTCRANRESMHEASTLGSRPFSTAFHKSRLWIEVELQLGGPYQKS
jgi:hypothetical protein